MSVGWPQTDLVELPTEPHEFWGDIHDGESRTRLFSAHTPGHERPQA